MANDREKATEESKYTVKYGNVNVKIQTTISQTRKDNGEKDTYVHRNWTVEEKDK